MGWLEFKGPKTRLTNLQKIFIRELNARHPGIAYVVRQPRYIEDHEGNVLETFNDEMDLLNKLAALTSERTGRGGGDRSETGEGDGRDS